MRRFWPLLVFIAILAVIVFKPSSPQNNNKHSNITSPQRIITLAPSITETAFALGLANNIVAVTNYCDYPEAALALPKVGGFVDPNLEAIVALQPDLVILLANQQKVITQLTQLGIQTLAVDNSTLHGIQASIIAIGQYTQHNSQAQQLYGEIQQKIHHIQLKTQDLSRPTILLSMGHTTGSEQLNTVYIAGQNDFYNDLIELAGGKNAFQDKRLKVPSLSTEGILQLNPDIILDIFPERDDHNFDMQNVLKQWQHLHLINAVKNNRIHIIEQNYATIPGPRIFLLLELMAKLIHPEVDWEDRN